MRLLDDSFKLHEKVLERMAEGVCLINDKGIILYTNAAEDAMFGYRPGELWGQHVRLQNAYSEKEFEEKVKAVLVELKEKGTWEGEWQNVRKNGSRFFTRARISSLMVGDRFYWICLQEDITHQKWVEEELKENERRFYFLAEAIPQIVWTATPQGAITYYNQRWFEYTGLVPANDFSWESVVHPDDLGEVQERWSHALQTGELYQVECRFRRADGVFRWHLSRALPLLDSYNRIVKWFGTSTDIDDQKRLGEELERRVSERTAELSESRAFLDSLIENLPNMVFVKDAKNLRFVRFNLAGENLLGYSFKELVGKNDYDFFSKEQADFFTSKDRAVLSGKTIVDIPEEEINTKSGLKILHTKKIPLFDAKGDPEYLLGISEDITEHKKAEEQRLGLIREQAARAVSDRAAERARFLAEAGICLASSLSYQETLRKLTSFLIPTMADACAIILGDEKREYGELVAAEHIDKSKIPLLKNTLLFNGRLSSEACVEMGLHSSLVAPISLRERSIGAILLFYATPGKKYAVEDQEMAQEIGRRAGLAVENARLYEQAQRAIQVRNEFLSIASHELKTPMTSLKLQIQMARRKINPELQLAPSPEKLAQVFDIAQKQVNRLVDLIESLLDVTRIESGKISYSFERTDFSEVVRDVVDRYRDQMALANCSVVFDASQGLWIKCDRFRMEQVVVNLLSNAMKYGAGKAVRVSVYDKGDKVRLEVQDHGIGVHKKEYKRIFDRFERAVSYQGISGLGLGLYISKQIVLGHGGAIWVESEVNRGSTFVVELQKAPALQQSA